MIITKTVNADFWIRERPQEVHAVQGDSCTRKITLNLFANREPWTPEENVSIVIRYHKPDGTNGTYDTLPNGEKAWELTDNGVSFVLAPQMLTVPGRVSVQVEILCNGGILASFPLCVMVEENVAAGATKSHSYFNWVQRLEMKLKEKLAEAKESGIFDGAVGATPELQIGTVTTLEAGREAGATMEGTAEKPVLNLAIPKGADAVIDDTLTVAGQAADAAAVGTALTGKAPAGYGLGGDTKYLVDTDDLNTITQCGFYSYAYNGIPANGIEITSPFQYVYHVAVTRDPNGTVIQSITTCGASANDANYHVRRVCGFGGWSAWEFVDPPMVNGVEYRTTERYMGKPVYTKVVSVGALPATGNTTATFGVSAPDKLVSCDVIAYHPANNDQVKFPIISGGILGYHYLNGWTLVIVAAQNLSGYTSCYATIKYTKTTD